MMPATWRAGLACVGIAVVAGVVYSASPAHADGEQLVKYGQTFTHVSGSTFTVTIDATITSLHVVGSPQSWICSHNNVGSGIAPCIPGQKYTFTDTTTLAGAPCGYLQSDEGNVFDTVPSDPAKAVCFPIVATSTPTPSATPTATPTPTEEPTSEPTSSPSATPSATGPAVSTPPVSESLPTPVATSSSPSTSSPTTSSIPRLPQAPRVTQTPVVAAPHELARTGFGDDPNETWPLIAAICGFGLFLIVAGWTARTWRARPRYKRGGTK